MGTAVFPLVFHVRMVGCRGEILGNFLLPSKIFAETRVGLHDFVHHFARSVRNVGDFLLKV